MYVVDISNPASPTFVGSYLGGTASAISVQGNYAYFTDSNSLKILDVTNPASPTLEYTTYSGYTTTPALYDTYLYNISSELGLDILTAIPSP